MNKLKLSSLIIITILITQLSSCAVVAIGTAALAVTDRRTTGAIIDDQKIEVESISKLSREDSLDKNTHFKVVSYNRIVLLGGEVFDENARSNAEQVVLSVNGVDRVINELAILEPSSISTRSHDSYLTAKVKTAMFRVEAESFDPSRIKIVTIRGIVYLMGILTQQETAEVVEIARNIKGVKEVVKVLEYIELNR